MVCCERIYPLAQLIRLKLSRKVCPAYWHRTRVGEHAIHIRSFLNDSKQMSRPRGFQRLPCLFSSVVDESLPVKRCNVPSRTLEGGVSSGEAGEVHSLSWRGARSLSIRSWSSMQAMTCTVPLLRAQTSISILITRFRRWNQVIHFCHEYCKCCGQRAGGYSNRARRLEPAALENDVGHGAGNVAEIRFAVFRLAQGRF